MSPLEITTKTEQQTKEFAQKCADDAQNGDIFMLNGVMGAGKSVFCRAFIQHLMGHDIDVPSPTFTLVQTYDTPKGIIWHFDLYRTEDPEEIYEIGWEEAVSDGILLIEWPERLGHLRPSTYKDITITALNETSRKITMQTYGGGK